MSRVGEYLRRATLHEEPDQRLLDCFIRHRDEAAFAALVRRHGPLVLGVCRRLLRDHHAAEDAFQATFLVLARKAASLHSRERLGGWLYGVAYRTALRARAMAARRRDKERRAARPASVNEQADDTAGVLDEELARLPEHYRLPVILCDLQGRSRRAAAVELSIPLGTLSSRLALARQKLRCRLARRGVAPGIVAAVALPPGLVQATAQAAAGKAATVSTQVLLLTEGVLKAMYVASICRGAGAVVALAFGLGATGPLLWPSAAEEPPARPAGAPPRPAPAPPALAEERRQALAHALDAADAIQDPQYKAWMLQAIGEAQTKAGDQQAALETLRKAVAAAKTIPEINKDHTLCWIAGALAATGAVKEAKEMAEAIEHDDSRDYGLSNIAVAQAKAGDFAGALETAQRGGRLQGQALWHLAEAQSQAGQVKEALAVAETIAEDASKALAFAFIARAQARAGDRDGARKTLQEALKVGEKLQDPERGDTRSSTVGQLAGVQALLGDVKAARELAESIKPETWRGSGLKQVAEAQCETGDLDGARDTAEAISVSYYKGEALLLVVEHLYRAGKADEARKVAESIWHPYWQLRALRALGQDLARRGRRDEAAQIFAKALAQAKDIPDEDPGLSGNHRNAVRAHLVQAQAEAGQARAALAWVHQQTDPLLRCQAFLNVAEGLAAREAARKPPAK